MEPGSPLKCKVNGPPRIFSEFRVRFYGRSANLVLLRQYSGDARCTIVQLFRCPVSEQVSRTFVANRDGIMAADRPSIRRPSVSRISKFGENIHHCFPTPFYFPTFTLFRCKLLLYFESNTHGAVIILNRSKSFGWSPVESIRIIFECLRYGNF